MFTESLLVQVFVPVTTTVYVVLANGLATGFAILELLSVAAGVHAYVTPPEACNCTDWLTQMVSALEMLMVGRGFTVTSTVSFAIHPKLVVPLTMY